uniref:SOSEKI DIX-like domain-containing protein n=1 Tax=Kalanchoe fedtschenkoi TaxID=63787 RepID=A0A7N0RA48_KALFE
MAEQLLPSSETWNVAAQTSSERNSVWTEPAGSCSRRMKKVSVVYYLSRNGHLEHPHFMEVPLSCPDGLYLKDVISRLNLLRGRGMAGTYSWSSKRSYKNGFVWHDLSENDFIHPVHGLEYVLKGSEILLLADADEPGRHVHSNELVKKSLEEDSGSNLGVSGRRNQPWSDASTQTHDGRRRRRLVAENERENQTVELEGSPPPVDSSPETLESLMKSDKRLMAVNPTQDACNGGAGSGEYQSGRLKASSVLMQLITCGSFSFRDCGAAAVKDHGLSLVSQYNGRVTKEAGVEEDFERVAVEDEEYFSGSVIETQGKGLPSLKRSSSYKY